MLSQHYFRKKKELNCKTTDIVARAPTRTATSCCATCDNERLKNTNIRVGVDIVIRNPHPRRSFYTYSGRVLVKKKKKASVLFFLKKK